MRSSFKHVYILIATNCASRIVDSFCIAMILVLCPIFKIIERLEIKNFGLHDYFAKDKLVGIFFEINIHQEFNSTRKVL